MKHLNLVLLAILLAMMVAVMANQLRTPESIEPTPVESGQVLPKPVPYNMK